MKKFVFILIVGIGLMTSCTNSKVYTESTDSTEVVADSIVTVDTTVVM